MRYGRVMRGEAVWAERVGRAASLWDRLRGLLGRKALGPGAALLIERCGSVHTVGMRFALDLVFLDRAWHVVRVVRDVRPGRLMVWGGWHAASVLESEAGCADLSGLAVGQVLRWETVSKKEGCDA